MDRFDFVTMLATTLVVCLFASFVAGFFFSALWHAHREPFIYPCPRPNEGGLCQYKNDAPPSHDEPAILFFS